LCNKLFAFYGSQARSVTLFIKTLFRTGFVKENKMAPSPVLVPAPQESRVVLALSERGLKGVAREDI
jgi:hypothetical protein